MKKSFWLTGMLLLMSLLTNIGYANDTIRWTWEVTINYPGSYFYLGGTKGEAAYYGSYFYFWGTEGESFVVDWGDGITEEVVSGLAGGESSLWGEYAAYNYVGHTYESSGTYTIILYGKTQGARIEKFYPSPSRYTNLLSLDVSKNANLEKLTCSNQRLTSLDVTKNPALTYLDCGDNRLAELDASKNENLETLFCSYNRLTSLYVAKNGMLNSVSMPHNKLPFSVVADVWGSLTEGATCYITPQPKEQIVILGKALSLPKLPLIADTRAHLDIWHKGELLKENQDYTIHDDSVYFEGIGEYKLVVWHDLVQERYEKYIDGEWRVVNKTYGDTTYVTVYSEYEDGNDVVRVTGILEASKDNYNRSVSFSFAGTAGQSFILDWGDGTKTVLEGTGEEINCSHNYDNSEVCPISCMLYGVTQESRITRIDHRWNGNKIKEMTMDVSDCPELKYLKCSYNDLKTLDITKNAKLEYLDCSGNELKVLDVSKNPLLTYLDCDYNGDWKVLDVSKNGNLTYLSCSENNLKSLDVSKNLKLEDLYCHWNHISVLDVSKNVKLKFFGCGANALTKLDVTKNSALLSLCCDMNALTELDVSKNVALEGLSCVSNLFTSLDVSKNEKLTGLACCWNRLTTLDISKNDNLKRLDCNDNRLQLLDISNNVLLEELYCENNLLTVLEMSENVNLTNLRCENNRLETLDVSKNVKLNRLECNNNRLKVLDISQNENLRELECSNNRLTSLDLKGEQGWNLECSDNFREVVLDAENGFDLANLPDMDVNRIMDIEGGTLDGTYLKFEADELRYKYSVGSRYASDVTVWFRLVSDKHAEPQIPLTAEFFPDDIFREYIGDFDKDGNDSLCKHECAVVREVDFSCPDGSWEYWSRGIKTLEGLQYFENLEKLYCDGNGLTSLDVSKNLKLRDLACDFNALTFLDISKNLELRDLGCSYNNLTSLDVSQNDNLDYLSCSHNRLPLSEIVNIKVNALSNGYYHYDIASYTPQYIPVTLKFDQVLDLSSEMVLKGVATEVDFGDIAESEYAFTNGRLKFKEAGHYQVRLTNDTVRNICYDANNREIYYGDIVEVFYDITVPADTPADPSDPDEPGEEPSDTTANEAALSAAPFAYVQGHTVYLTDGLGEVEALTVMGQRVYKGYDRAITLPRPGVYILRVVADGRRCKVIVR